MFSIYRMFHWTNPMVGESHRSNCCSPGPVALWPCGPFFLHQWHTPMAGHHWAISCKDLQFSMCLFKPTWHWNPAGIFTRKRHEKQHLTLKWLQWTMLLKYVQMALLYLLISKSVLAETWKASLLRHLPLAVGRGSVKPQATTRCQPFKCTWFRAEETHWNTVYWNLYTSRLPNSPNWDTSNCLNFFGKCISTARWTVRLSHLVALQELHNPPAIWMSDLPTSNPYPDPFVYGETGQ